MVTLNRAQGRNVAAALVRRHCPIELLNVDLLIRYFLWMIHPPEHTQLLFLNQNTNVRKLQLNVSSSPALAF